jgi:hypothetical protein
MLALYSLAGGDPNHTTVKKHGILPFGCSMRIGVRIPSVGSGVWVGLSNVFWGMWAGWEGGEELEGGCEKPSQCKIIPTLHTL